MVSRQMKTSTAWLVTAAGCQGKHASRGMMLHEEGDTEVARLHLRGMGLACVRVMSAAAIASSNPKICQHVVIRIRWTRHDWMLLISKPSRSDH